MKSNNAEKMFEIQFVHLLNFVKLKCTVNTQNIHPVNAFWLLFFTINYSIVRGQTYPGKRFPI